MKTVHKYDAPVTGDDDLVIEMPVEAEILCVQVQGTPKIWARIDTDKPTELRRFCWCGTGHDADGLGRYVGTVQAMNGALVFHLFEVE